MYETDLPCSACGTELDERTVHTRDLLVSTGRQGDVRVADCPSCDARYYPKDTLSRLFESTNDASSGGDD